MKQLSTPQSKALFGVFLQDVKEIEKKYPKYFKNKYPKFECHEIDGKGFGLSFEPYKFPRNIKKDILKAFNSRLNDLYHEV
jgi:hypothetical protein